MRDLADPGATREGAPTAALAAEDDEATTPVTHYTSPLLIPQGTVREATRGSSSSGTADANSQFYW